MTAAQVAEIRRRLVDLERDIDRATRQVPSRDLPAVREALDRAAERVREICAGSVLPRPSEGQLRAYAPSRGSPRRAVDGEEMAQADARWEEGLRRGRSHRDEALAYVGPVLTPAEAAARLGVSAVTLNNWRRRNRLLALRFDGHQHLYPVFQFAASPAEGEDGTLRHFAELLALLDGAPAWAKVQFFRDPAPLLDGRTPLEVLRAGKPDALERARALARHWGEAGP
jgi:hypothetical protein